jgi:AraC-like DNA-binding protein
MTADALSDVLKSVRLTGAAFFDVVGKAPWVAEQPPRERIMPFVMPGAGHLISYHVVTEGRCFANLVGAPPLEVAAGEVVVFTRGDAHVMASAPGMRAPVVSTAAFEALRKSGTPFALEYGGEGDVATRLVCGFLGCEARPFNPLLENLPPVIKAGGSHVDDGGWLGQFVRLAAAESSGPRAGSAGVLARLSELMFIEAVRQYLETLPAGQVGWLAGLRDPSVGKALSLMHADPAHRWTLDALAREAGLSRSALAERFAAFVGMPPMQYLARWRMQIAAERLAGGRDNIAAIAADAGYGSEAAFSRAFKKLVGMPPSDWRSRRDKSTAEASD